MRKKIFWLSGAALALILLGTAAGYGNANLEARVIKITARAFEYIPSEITLKKGEPVVLELTSQDLFHGFSISDLGLRADLPPGKTARVQLIPDKAGVFPFHCDNFCGIGHENMTGVITVVE
ncbi:MAG: cupredoxin domain-containing protein [Burkholderiales bacterium]